MSVVSKKTITKYVEMCSHSGRVWTEGEIISFRSLINTKLNDAPDVRDMLLERFNQSLAIAPFQLEGSQQVKGLEYLKRTQLNIKGELRKASTTFMGAFEVAVLRDFECFEFVGLRNHTYGYHSKPTLYYVPVYRCISSSGAWFEYSAKLTGGFEVTNVCYGPAKIETAPLKPKRHLNAV